MSRWSGTFGEGLLGTFRSPFYRVTRSFQIHQSEPLSGLHDYTFTLYQSTSRTRLNHHKIKKKGENILSKNITPHHIPSKPNSNILSRQPGYNEGIDDNNDIVYDITIFHPHTPFKSLRINPCHWYPCSCQASFKIDQT